MPSSYTRKKIDVTVQIGKGSFGASGFDTVKLSGLRVSAEITNVGGPSMGEANIRVYGLPPALMNQLTTLGLYARRDRDNRVTIEAGDDVSGMSLVYQGTIGEAWVDYTGMPDVFLSINGLDGYLSKVKPVPPSSYSGAADCATIMQSLATTMGLRFENNGVSVQLSNPYFPGKARDQADSCAKAGGFSWYSDGDTLAIWPQGGSRGGAVPLISPDTGMMGYPSYGSSGGVALRTLYNPSVRFGSQIEVKSSVPPACGKWFVRVLSHTLESETPGGAWEPNIQAIRTSVDAKGGSGIVGGNVSSGDLLAGRHG